MSIYKVREAREFGKVVFTGTLKEIANEYNLTMPHTRKMLLRGGMMKKEFNIVGPESPDKLVRANEYMICDTEENDMVIFIGIKKEVMKWLDIKESAFYESCGGRYKLNKRYEIYKIEDM